MRVEVDDEDEISPSGDSQKGLACLYTPSQITTTTSRIQRESMRSHCYRGCSELNIPFLMGSSSVISWTSTGTSGSSTCGRRGKACSGPSEASRNGIRG